MQTPKGSGADVYFAGPPGLNAQYPVPPDLSGNASMPLTGRHRNDWDPAFDVRVLPPLNEEIIIENTEILHSTPGHSTVHLERSMGIEDVQDLPFVQLKRWMLENGFDSSLVGTADGKYALLSMLRVVVPRLCMTKHAEIRTRRLRSEQRK